MSTPNSKGPARVQLVPDAQRIPSVTVPKELEGEARASFLADVIRKGTSWAESGPNGADLRNALRHSTTSFLTDQWRQGALLGRTPDEAFYVICDDTNNTPTTIDGGRVICDIGVAPVRPAEFVHFTITQIAGEPGRS